MKTRDLVPIIAASALLGLVSPVKAAVIAFTGNTTATLPAPLAAAMEFNGLSPNITTDASGNSAAFSIGSLVTVDYSKRGFYIQPVTVNLNITSGPFAGTVASMSLDAYGYNNGFGGGAIDIWGLTTTPQLVTYAGSGGTGSFDIGFVGYEYFASEIGKGFEYYWTPGSPIQAQITNAMFTPAAPVSEPMPLSILGVGLVGLGIAARRHRA